MRAARLAIETARKEAEAPKDAHRHAVEALFMDAPALSMLIRGDSLEIEFANPLALEVMGKTCDAVVMPMLDAVPELRGQGFDDLRRQVISTTRLYQMAFSGGGCENYRSVLVRPRGNAYAQGLRRHLAEVQDTNTHDALRKGPLGKVTTRMPGRSPEPQNQWRRRRPISYRFAVLLAAVASHRFAFLRVSLRAF